METVKSWNEQTLDCIAFESSFDFPAVDIINGDSTLCAEGYFDVDDIAKSQEYDLVIYGHTHNQDFRKIGKTQIVNPGESTDWLSGQGRLVILNSETMDYEVVNIN